MKRGLRHALAGIGSALDIFPDSDYSKYIDERTPDERMRSHFEQTGQSLQRAMNQIGDERKKKK